MRVGAFTLELHVAYTDRPALHSDWAYVKVLRKRGEEPEAEERGSRV